LFPKTSKSYTVHCPFVLTILQS